jgi:hypothetical protein
MRHRQLYYEREHMFSKYRRVSDADQRLFSDVSMCNIVVCDKMREGFVDQRRFLWTSTAFSWILSSQSLSFGHHALFLVPHPTQRRSEWTARPLSRKRLKMRLHVGIAATKTPNVPLRFTMVSRAGIRLWMSRFPT